MRITSLKRRSITSLKYFAYEELNKKCKIHYWKIIKTQIPVNFKLLRTDSAPLPKNSVTNIKWKQACAAK